MWSVRLVNDRSKGASPRRETSCHVVHDRFLGSVPLGLLPLRYERREVCCLHDRPGLENHLLTILAHDNVVLAPIIIEGRKVEPAVGAAAFLAPQRRARHSPG